MKYIILTIFIFAFFGCSATTVQTAWTRTKDASYTAITDPVTWAPLAAGVTLYTTRTDDHITHYIMKHPILNTKDSDTQSIASLSGNAVTLPSGTYIVRGSALFYNTNLSQIRLYNKIKIFQSIFGTYCIF